jgi:hypothetical protein
LVIVHLWNDNGKFQIVGGYLWMLGVAILIATVVTNLGPSRWNWGMLAWGLVVAAWGLIWANRQSIFRNGELIRIPRLELLQHRLRLQLPVFGLIVSALVLLASVIAIFWTQERSLRYLAAVLPIPPALGIGCLSNQERRRWMQFLSLALLTISLVMIGWADLSREELWVNPLSVWLRTFLVLAGAMAVYGILVSRWVRPGDSWLKTLLEMAVANCGLAVICLVAVVYQEFASFDKETGCGISIAESLAVGALAVGMVVGLITIAVKPKNDPFTLSLQGRMGYVYVGQFVTVLLVCHLFFSMPWLFRLGIAQYWPYILMALTIGGVGIAQVLEKRNLTVLGQPLFHTAAILPALASALIWTIDSKADSALVLLVGGLAYLLISYTRQSILSGAVGLILGNLAIWVFYERLPGFSFFEHPQWWLIPPAVSVLIAAQLSATSLTKYQLALIRYLCVSVIYVSSTSEIFIHQIGTKVWPPMVLAFLSVLGMMLGIMFRVRAYLFFGSLFLLMAMIAMISHAHQRLDHVWPWWAFGIGMGIAILVLFGYFERRRTKLKAIAVRFQHWEL